MSNADWVSGLLAEQGEHFTASVVGNYIDKSEQRIEQDTALIDSLRAERDQLRKDLNVAKAQATHDAAALRDCRDLIGILEEWRDRLEAERSRLRAELTHEKGSREQAEALCVVLRAHREEYAAQVIEGHAEIANITADNKRLRAAVMEEIDARTALESERDQLRAELAECRRDADRFKTLDALCVQSANACGRIWRIDLPAATFDFLLDIDAALAAGEAK